MKIVEYKIARGVDGNLAEAVNQMIADGWQPLGGLAAVVSTVRGYGAKRQHVYSQAMVRYESQ